MLIGLREAGEAGPQELRVRRFANLSCSAFHRQGTLYSAMSMFLSCLVRALRSLCAPGIACNEFPWNAPPAPCPLPLAILLQVRFRQDRHQRNGRVMARISLVV